MQNSFVCRFITGVMDAVWQQDMEASGDVSLDSEMPQVCVHPQFLQCKCTFQGIIDQQFF